jgi:Family of unknown function (DUF6117)
MAKNRGPLKAYKANFESLKLAFANGDVGMAHCKDSRTGKEVAVLIAVHKSDVEEYVMTPFAIMCEGNPYEYLQAPNPDGGFFPVEVVNG